MKKITFAFLLCFCIVIAGYAGSEAVEAPAAPPPAAQGNDETEDVPVEPVNFQFVPGLGTAGVNHKATNYVLFGMLSAIGHNLRGFGLSGISLINTGYVAGFQSSGLFNIVSRDMTGLQMAGLFNRVREDMRGVQASGIFNIIEGSGTGLQTSGVFNWTGESFRGLQMGLVNYDGGDDGLGMRIGLVNVSKSENVIPIGLVNIVKNGIMHPAVWYDDLGFVNLSLKSGSRYFYSILGLGVHNSLFFDDDPMFVTRTGIGAELPLDRFFLDFDLTAGHIFSNFSWTENNAFIAQARLSAGYKIFKHLGIFVGVSYDYIISPRNGSLKPGKDFGFSALAWSSGRNTHKIGFFGGVQF
ncbi:MAG: hypothetical protein LBG26_03305 [Treponema sp.]|jgi:hypothetical protein|nr:hypothetical protein [Treponema sp.]